MTTKIKRCPFCNSGLINVGQCHDGGDYGVDMFSVECRECGGESGHRVSESEAINAWNQRASEWKKFNEPANLKEKKMYLVRVYEDNRQEFRESMATFRLGKYESYFIDHFSLEMYRLGDCDLDYAEIPE